jgi:pilus assembly protein Flp/PilA
MTKLLSRLWKDEEGPTAVEYALMLFMVGVAVAVVLPSLRDAVVAVFKSATTAVGG